MENKKFIPYDQTHKIEPLLLLGVIVNQGQGHEICRMLRQYEVGLCFATHGIGTAPSNMVAMISSNSLKKTTVLSIIRANKWPEIKAELENRFSISDLAKGVAFTSPIDAVSGVSIYKMLTNTRKYEKPVKELRK